MPLRPQPGRAAWTPRPHRVGSLRSFPSPLPSFLASTGPRRHRLNRRLPVDDSLPVEVYQRRNALDDDGYIDTSEIDGPSEVSGKGLPQTREGLKDRSLKTLKTHGKAVPALVAPLIKAPSTKTKTQAPSTKVATRPTTDAFSVPYLAGHRGPGNQGSMSGVAGPRRAGAAPEKSAPKKVRM